jgi:hypothetical protein
VTAPASDPARDKEVRRDDFLGLSAILVGVAIAFIGRHVMLELGGGVALASGGVLLAIRGGRRIESRGWLTCALVLAAFAFLSVSALQLYEEWEAGQWLAQGPQTGAAPDAMRNLYRTVAALRVGGLAGSLIFLLFALTNRIRSK